MYVVYMFYICMKKLDGEILYELINSLEDTRIYNKESAIICMARYIFKKQMNIQNPSVCVHMYVFYIFNHSAANFRLH